MALLAAADKTKLPIDAFHFSLVYQAILHGNTLKCRYAMMERANACRHFTQNIYSMIIYLRCGQYIPL